MKYCPTCNAEYGDQYRFCRLDGRALTDKQESDTAQTKSEIKEGWTTGGTESLVETHLESQAPSPEKNLLSSPHEPIVAPSAGTGGGSPESSPTRTFLRYTATGKIGEDLRFRRADGERFEMLVQEEIKKAFPSAFVRSGVQIRSLRRTTEVDLFVLMPEGVFLIECKSYSGKISGSVNYDQDRGESWTCETQSGQTVEIKSSGKNPADQSLNRFYALHDLAKEAWGEDNRPYIHPVLLFPDGADLSGVTGLPIYPERPSTRDRVVATTLPKIISYLANADASVEAVGALKLINEILGIPRSSLSGTWLDQPFKTEEKTAEQESFEESSSFPQEPEAPAAEDQYSFDEVPPREPRHPSTSRALVATSAVVVGVLLLLILGRWIFYPGSTKPPDLASLKETPLRQPAEGSASPPLEPETQYPPATPGPIGEPPTIAPEREPGPGILSREKSTPPTRPETVTPGGAMVSPIDKPDGPVEKVQPPIASPITEAKVRETPIPQRPAEPGTYETISVTYARRKPGDSAAIIDELKPGIRFEVIGSEANWLIVQSKKRQTIVYIKRDDAMFISARNSPGQSFQEAQAQWKKVEIEINEALLKRGIIGVTVSFIGDTAYLKGQVKTENERFAAEQAARSFPEVQHVFNGIWVVP